LEVEKKKTVFEGKIDFDSFDTEKEYEFALDKLLDNNERVCW